MGLLRRRWQLLALLGLIDLLFLGLAGWWVYREARWSMAEPPGQAAVDPESGFLGGDAVADGEADSASGRPAAAEMEEGSLLETYAAGATASEPASPPTLLAAPLTPSQGLARPEARAANQLILPNLGCVITATGGLITEFKAISEAMPRADSQGMVVPTEAQLAAWEGLVRFTLSGDLPAACALIQANGFPYHILRFTDLPYFKEKFLILKEDLPVTVGWGTYVFRQRASATPLVVEVPHPLADGRTNLEGVEIFRKVNARALLMAGAHRCANQQASGCSGLTEACGGLAPYRSSDVAHTDRSMFQAAHRALVACGNGLVALQLHGNSLTGCPDLFVGNGTVTAGLLSQAIATQAKAFCSGYSVDLADNQQPECAFSGGTIVQGIESNGCGLAPRPDACTGSVSRPAEPEQFILLEQSLALRKDYDCLIEALKVVFP